MIDIFKYIRFVPFFVSLAFGLLAIYVTSPDQRKIFVYPTHDNVHVMQYRDKTGTCYEYEEKSVSCPSDKKDKIRTPPQV